jgi:glycosyltransferase involved in cell wall biosynthesis
MKIIHLSYARITDFSDPNAWLKRINFFVALVEQMAREAEVKSIHCINYSGIINRNGVEYHFLKRHKFQLWMPYGLHQYVRNLSPNVIIVHGLAFPWQVLWLYWQLGNKVKIVVQHHSEIPLGHYKGILQRVADHFIRAYFFPSMDQARPWVAKGQIGSLSKVHEIMEVPSVFHIVDKKQAQSRTNVTSEITYLWVGRLDENKDPLTLIKGFIKFARTHPLVGLYVIYRQEELIEDVRKLLLECGNVSEQIVLVGKVEHEDLLYWFNSAEFILSTSHYEGMGVAVCEAMSCGCIPILTEIAPFKKMTNNGEFGLHFKPGDHDDLDTVLEKSLLVNLETQREKTLDYYRSNLSSEAISGKMLSVVKALPG